MNLSRNQLQQQQPRNRVKNILIRHCGSKKVRSDCLADGKYEHPENCYLAKYLPKYYRNLTLLMKPGYLLSLKIKRIKKLRRFTANFNDQVPQVSWFKILKHNRKEIEEFPQIHLSDAEHVFWTKTVLRVVKFFFWITKLQLATFPSARFDPKNFLAIWENFSAFLRGMRRLKTLKIYMDFGSSIRIDSEVARSFSKKLNTMPRLLRKLEVLKSPSIFDVSQNGSSQKNSLFSYVTNLEYLAAPSAIYEPCQIIPQLCKNLKSFSLEFTNSYSYLNPSQNFSKFRGFIRQIQELPKLQSISIHWLDFWPLDFWSYFTPPVSLRRLALHFDVYYMRKAVFQDSSSNESKDLIKHWKEIKELDALNLNIKCRDEDEMLFTKSFITTILKKVSKLTSFQCKIDFRYEGIWRYEPFFAEEVPHLYEHLKKLKVSFGFYEGPISFNLSFLRPFKNLKEIKCKGYCDSWVNIEIAVHLLQENANYGEYPTLKLEGINITYMEELKNILKKISKTKKEDNNLKIMLALNFDIQAGDDEVRCLDQFCKVIESEIIKGSEISLEMRYQDYSECNTDEVRRVLRKYPGLRNFELQIHYNQAVLQYFKRHGEKEQLVFYPEDN